MTVFPEPVKRGAISDSIAGWIYGDLIRHVLRLTTAGTGLGLLVIARNMIRAHGGLWAVSERGASFVFSQRRPRRPGR